MNIVIVGFGTIGEYYLKVIRKNFLKTLGINKIYIIDIKFKNKIETKKITYLNFKSYEELKILSKFAIIASPSYLHYQHANYFLKKGSNVLLEKPFVLNIKHAYKLINKSKLYKLKCWTVFQNRYNKAVIKIQKDIKKSKSVFLVDASLYWSRSIKYYKSSTWRGKYKTDGGVLVNQAIHMLDIIFLLFGKFSNFSCVALFNKKN